jgi:hypothetical protein
MTRYSLKPLTENSWILLADGERSGLVNRVDDAIRVIGKIASGTHESIDALKIQLGGKLLIEQTVEPVQEKEQGQVNGYPIKHGEWHNVVVEPVPSYTRTAKSEHRYAAGYYGLRFPNGWTQSFCPKLSTLADYEYIGPFTTKLEMQHQISSKNKTINV